MAGPSRVCDRCKRRIDAELGAPIPTGRMALACLAGFGVAVVGAALWAGVQAATGYQLGIVAIAVGWGVATAMRKISGQGSRLLQVAAVFLVYVSISLAMIPEVAQSAGEGVVGWIVAVPLSFAMPFLMWSGGISAALWYLIVFFGFQRAWTGLSPARIHFTGPVSA